MICTFCGAEIEDDSVFCTTCGSKLDSVPVEDTDHRINESYSDNDSANNTTIAFDEDAAIGNPSSQDDDGMNEGGIDEEAASEWDESAEPQDENETLDKAFLLPNVLYTLFIFNIESSILFCTPTNIFI